MRAEQAERIALQHVGRTREAQVNGLVHGLFALPRMVEVADGRVGVRADSLLVKPDQEMLLVHIVLAEEATAEAVPRVSFDDEATLPLRLETAIGVADAAASSRIAVELPGTMWEDAGEGRSAQHFAITLLDALCSALS